MRKPFEPFKFMVSGVPSQDIVTIKEANAAIEQDTEFHRDRLKYWSEQELKVLLERDALKAEVERLTNNDELRRETNYKLLMEIKKNLAQLVEAEAVIEWTAQANDWSLAQGNADAVIGKARAYLTKHRADGKGEG